ncbi:MAG: deoxyribonuclease IV [Treponema sp.]|nr:deoxyribonuclease IV [Treponema sp.]MBR4631616.1 deoxyribonuclease IV [Treponema sp.]
MHIGYHLSSSGGFLKMGETALKAKADTFAFFTRNPRGGGAKEIDSDDAAKLCSLLKENSFAPLVAHAPYTLNACSDKEDIREYAKMVFKDDLQRMEAVPNQLYNFHPGSEMKQGKAVGIKMICDMLNSSLTKEQTTTVLLETMAGKGSEVGSRFEELKSIIDSVELDEKLGVCLDTCHVYDAGYDIVNHLDEVLSEFDNVIGLKRLRAVHLNDSKNPFSSHKDRHEKIGFGSIPLDAFSRIVNHPALKNLPFILETPWSTTEEYAEEIKLVRGLEK